MSNINTNNTLVYRDNNTGVTDECLHREPIEGRVRPLCCCPCLGLLVLLAREPLRLHLPGQLREESVPAPVVVLLLEGGLRLQTTGQHSGQLKCDSQQTQYVLTSGQSLPT